MQGIPIKQANFYQSIMLNGKQEFTVMKDDNRARGNRSYDLELIGQLLFLRHKEKDAITLIPLANIKEMQIDTEAQKSSWQEKPQVNEPAAIKRRARKAKDPSSSPVKTL
jgi:hypothetical protein